MGLSLSLRNDSALFSCPDIGPLFWDKSWGLQEYINAYKSAISSRALTVYFLCRNNLPDSRVPGQMLIYDSKVPLQLLKSCDHKATIGSVSMLSCFGDL